MMILKSVCSGSFVKKSNFQFTLILLEFGRAVVERELAYLTRTDTFIGQNQKKTENNIEILPRQFYQSTNWQIFVMQNLRDSDWVWVVQNYNAT